MTDIAEGVSSYEEGSSNETMELDSSGNDNKSQFSKEDECKKESQGSEEGNKMDETIDKYTMCLESERNIYVTGATMLLIKGLITYEEYMSNNFKTEIPQEILDKRFYLSGALGKIRGLTRLNLAKDANRYPAVTMYQKMKEEDMEILENGGQFVTDSEDSSVEESSSNASRNGENSDTSGEEATTDRDVNAKCTNGGRKGKSCGGEGGGCVKKCRTNIDTAEEKVQSPFACGKLRIPAESLLPTVSAAATTTNVNKQKQEKENALPEELLMCGDCGISISSVEHLDRHLERCRGHKSRQQAEFRRKIKKNNLLLASDQCETSGKLCVYETNDGEVIDGWESLVSVPPGPTCPKCAFDVPTLYDLPLHQRHHKVVTDIVCPVCPFSTKSTQIYLIHIEEHAF